MKQPVPIDVRLQRLCYRQAGSTWRAPRPYLWTAMFRIDGEQLSLSEQFHLQGDASFRFSEGSHGNLGPEAWEAGTVRPIPTRLGHWRSHLQPVQVPFFNYAIPGTLGVIAVLMLARNVSEAGAEAGHAAFRHYVTEAVNASLRQFDVRQIDVENIRPSIKAYLAGEVQRLEPGIEAAVTEAIMQQQNIFQNLWTLLDRDQLVGYRVWDLQASELVAEGGQLPLHARWESPELGIWELDGHIHIEDGSEPLQRDIPIE